MSYCAYITKVKEIRPHSNADRLQVATVFGNDVIVGLDTKLGDLMIYFPTDGRLGVEYCEANNLLRKKDENGKEVGGYLDPSKRHVSTIKLRGEKSDGLLIPVSSLKDFTDVEKLKEGDTITWLNDVEICKKYIPNGKKRRQGTPGQGEVGKKKLTKIQFPYFEEHRDTSQLAYNLNQFREGDICVLSLKCHGTSARTGYTVKSTKTRIPSFLFPLTKLFKISTKSKKSWEYISGSRRVVLTSFDNGFYGSDNFRKKWHDFFKGKLHKGESIYYEIVGFTEGSQLIMPECNNSKTKDKEFIKQYGDTTRFTYGCGEGENNIYVYRMTMTNEDGVVVEYPTSLISLRCEQMGVNQTPILDRFIFTTQEDLMERVNKHLDGADPIGINHIREGVICRIENREKFTALKHKSFLFKLIEGIIKLDDVLDMEEEQDVSEQC